MWPLDSQDLCKSLAITELESVADFPVEMEAFRDLLTKVSGHNSLRLKMTAEMADSSQRVGVRLSFALVRCPCDARSRLRDLAAQVKSLIIKAEDARLLADMALMRRHYAEVRASASGLRLS